MSSQQPAPTTQQAALLLHGLDERDRDWIMTRLPAGERLELAGHLNELTALGIPADQQLIRAATRAGDDENTAVRMHAVLVNEPLWLQASILAIEAWPWRDAYLAGLPADRRERLVRLMPTQLAPSAARAIQAQLAARLSAAPVVAHMPTTAPAARPGNPFARWVRRWL
jgi:hypothetical protein